MTTSRNAPGVALVPVLPLSPGRIERHGFEYYRHGTLSLYAAPSTQTGEVLGKTAARHTSDEFVAFLDEIVDRQPAQQEKHIIADNASAHKATKVEAFLKTHPNVRLHFTPTYSSWLNQVELWFSKSTRDVLARGIFTSIADRGGRSCATSNTTIVTRSRFAGATLTTADASHSFRLDAYRPLD
jgi:transposase